MIALSLLYCTVMYFTAQYCNRAALVLTAAAALMWGSLSGFLTQRSSQDRASSPSRMSSPSPR